MKKLILLTLLVAAVSGCCSYQISTINGRTMAYAENSGWKLLALIPIASGDLEYPNQEVASWWEDTVTLENNMKLMDMAAREYGATGYRELSSYRTKESVFLFLFRRYTYHTSAELIR